MRSVRSSAKEKLTDYVKPMLATLTETAFDDSDWIFEIKWDGYRAIAEVNGDDVSLYSRNGLSFKGLYPSIVNELSRLKINAVLDGELVVFNDSGKPDFQKLQQFGELKHGSLVYYVFDCLAINGESIKNLPLIKRKERLKELLHGSVIVKFADHVAGYGVQFFKAAAEMDLEGIIAKRANSLYIEGKRSTDWLKIKHQNIQEAIIAGYTAPRGGRAHFGALILAIKDRGKLKYIGHTGTGFSYQTLKKVHEKLTQIKIDASPFDTKVPINGAVTWVKPELICNITFTEITQGGILRHPVFMGIRIDKTANETNRIEKPTALRNSRKKISKSQKDRQEKRPAKSGKLTTKKKVS